MGGRVFLVPSLARDELGIVPWVYAGDPPWTDLALDIDEIDALVCDQLAPVLRGLILAGYDADAVYVGLAPQAPAHVLGVDLYELRVSSPATVAFEVEVDADGNEIGDGSFEAYWPTEGPAVVLDLLRRRCADGEPLEIELPQSPEQLWRVEGSRSQFLIFTGDPDARDLASAVAPAISAFIDALVMTLGDRLIGVVAPAEQAGLLWIFSPFYWPAPTADESGDPLEVIGMVADIARSAIGSKHLSTEDFIRGQLVGRDRLRKLLRKADGVRANALSRIFFRAVSDELELREIYVPPGFVERLEEAPWIDVIFHLAELGIIELPDLNGLAEDEPEATEPIREEQSPDGKSIAIYVHGQQEPIVLTHVRSLTRVVDDGESSELQEIPFGECVAWEYIDGAEDGLPRLLIVAAPGVAISPPERPTTTWTPEIYRVQDVALVPPRGARIQTELLEGPVAVERLRTSAAEPAVLVRHRGNGVTLSFPGIPGTTGDTQAAVFVEVNPYSADDQFTYDVVRLDATSPDGTHYFGIVIAATEQVRVREFHINGWNWEIDPIPALAVVNPLLALGVTVFTYKYEVFVYRVAAETIQPPGNVLDIDRNALRDFLTIWVRDVPVRPPHLGTIAPSVPRDGTAHERSTTPSESIIWWFQLGLDVALGLIPLVGDALDIEEFLLALATSKDRWGRPVAWYEKVLMGGGCAIPFVSSSWLRGLGRGIANEVALVVGGALPSQPFKAAAPVDTPAPRIERVLERGEDGEIFTESLSTMARRWAQEAGILAEGAYLHPADVLSSDGRNFLVPQLQYLLLRERVRSNNPGLPLAEFLKSDDPWIKAVVNGLFGTHLAPLTVALARRSRQPSRRWWSLGHFVPRAPGVDAATLASTFNTPAAVTASVERLVGTGSDVVADRVLTVLRLVAPDGDLAKLDAAALQKLVGTKEYEPDDFVFMLASSLEIMDGELARAAPDLATVRPLEDYLKVPGITDFIKDVVTRSGYEHGTRYEMFTLARLLDEVGDPSAIRYQHYIGSAKGPDFLVFIGGRARIVQCKSYARLDSLRSSSGTRTVTGKSKKSSNAIIQQYLRTLERLGPTFKVTDNTGALVALDGETTFYIDSWWLDMNYAGEIDEELHDISIGLTEQLNVALAKQGLPFTVKVEVF